MNPTKTIMLRFKPIAEITEEEMKEKTLVTDGEGHWCEGFVSLRENGEYYANCGEAGIMFGFTHYAVLPKDE